MAETAVLYEFQQVTVRSTRGCATLRFIDPHVALLICEGIAAEDFVPPLVEEIEQQRRGPLVLAIDASGLSSYETGFRKLLTDWLAANPPSSVLALSRSRLVGMGLAVANAVLGGTIRSFTNELEFRRALAVERERFGATAATT